MTQPTGQSAVRRTEGPGKPGRLKMEARSSIMEAMLALRIWSILSSKLNWDLPWAPPGAPGEVAIQFLVHLEQVLGQEEQ